MDEGQSSMMEAQLANLTAMEGEANVVFPNQRSAETKAYTMLKQMMKMMTDQKKETDERFQALESAVKQLQTRASSTDVNLGNLQAQVNIRLPSQPVANPRDNVQNNDEESETEVQKVRFNDRTEENLVMPKADSQLSRTAPRETEKSHLQQPTISLEKPPSMPLGIGLLLLMFGLD
ncbi:hypothetical protein GOBAR_DD33062 [Gossypium barbadense]|nr:hypothetical protein GOBAR_DD33062 [Gossypium barbadense]